MQQMPLGISDIQTFKLVPARCEALDHTADLLRDACVSKN